MTTSEGQQATSTATWQLDPTASSVTFEHKAMWGLATVRGTFSGLSGSGEIHPDGSASGRLVIDAHPQIVADISAVTRQGGATAAVTGTLTVAGVTRPVTFTAAIAEETGDAVTLKAETHIDRADFGMSWNQLGTIKGNATISVVARFTRPADKQKG
jgi:polyisoprenoid-binding protein YceI